MGNTITIQKNNTWRKFKRISARQRKIAKNIIARTIKVNTMAEPISINVNDGGAMYAHEMSVNLSPTQFMLDYKMITPRTDPRGKGRPTFLIQHNVIIIDPWHAKSMIEVMQASVKRYEEEYGKIQKPKAVAKAEKKQKQLQSQTTDSKDTPNYMG